MANTIGLFASSRRHGNTGKLMDRIAAALDMEVVDLGAQRISAYDYEHRNRGDDFEPLMERVLHFEQIILASPVYWYAVSPPLKVFLDRITDYLDLPELLEKGRQLRNKRVYVVCTSIYEEVPPSFIGALRDTFDYLGMQFGGVMHANCQDGYRPERYEDDIQAFVRKVMLGRS